MSIGRSAAKRRAAIAPSWRWPRVVGALTAVCVATAVIAAEKVEVGAPRQLEASDLKALTWRSIGPANMGGRVAALAVAPGDPKTFFIGYATSGVWKTTNLGTTFSPIFDEYETASIGSIALARVADDADDRAEATPGRPGGDLVVWVGTGESNGRNSSSWGHGVYRSTDGGDSFEHVGLADSHDIPALTVDPRDPDTCYVAALGHLWGANDERGGYKTSDGGVTWTAVLQIDADTGACDVVLDPGNPDIVYAAMYARRRTAYSFRSGGPEGGIYRSTNGGARVDEACGGSPGPYGPHRSGHLPEK